jgi:hypothetical protein
MGLILARLGQASRDLSNGCRGVVIGVRYRENDGWQQVYSVMNQLLGSAGNQISDSGGWTVPETAEAAE